MDHVLTMHLDVSPNVWEKRRFLIDVCIFCPTDGVQEVVGHKFHNLGSFSPRDASH